MQGANTQQQAIGQGAALQAQQSLGALNQLGGIAQNQVGNQQAAQSALSGQNLQQQQIVNNSIAGSNSANVAAQTPLNEINTKFGNSVLSGALGGAGTTVQTGIAALNGQPSNTQAPTTNVPSTDANFKMPEFKYQGGMVGSQQTMQRSSGPMSMIGRHQAGNSMSHMPTMMAQGGQVQGAPVAARVSPGEKILSKADAEAVKAGRKDPMSAPTVPGKAMVKGNSLKNDTVDMTLEAGGCVIPRSVLQSKDPHAAAARFVAEHLKKSRK